jgi:serine protease Do
VSNPDSSEPTVAVRRLGLLVAIVAVVAALVGAFLSRSMAPAPTADGQAQQRRPIVQIVRQQPGLPSLADTIDHLCPSIAEIVPAGATPTPPPTSAPTSPSKRSNSKSGPSVIEAPAFAISADGWLVTSTPLPAADQYEAVFGDGTRLGITEIRTDPVSGISVAKADTTTLSPVTVEDQSFPRVGDFGLALQTPSGNGCSADIAMVGSDFLADGGGPVSYVRLQSGGPALPPGIPFVSGDGRVIGLATSQGNTPDALIPSPIAATIVDELIRNSPSPTIAFGFRATDFTPGLSARLGDTRSRGTGVALVEPKSGAAKAGLRAGDVIVAVDDSPISSASELGRALDADDKTASLTVVRGGQRLTLNVARD